MGVNKGKSYRLCWKSMWKRMLECGKNTSERV